MTWEVRTTHSFRRGAGVAGIGFFVLVLLSFIFGPGDPPAFDDSAEMVASYVGDNQGELQASMAFSLAAGPFLLMFLAGLVRTLRLREEQGPAMLASVAFAGGILLAAFAVLGGGLQWAAGAHVGDLDAGTVRALWDAGLISFAATIGIGSAVLIGATSVVALVHGGLPRMLAAAGAAFAVYSFVVGVIATFADTGVFSISNGALPLIGFLGFLLWILLVGVHLVAGKEEGAAA